MEVLFSYGKRDGKVVHISVIGLAENLAGINPYSANIDSIFEKELHQGSHVMK